MDDIEIEFDVAGEDAGPGARVAPVGRWLPASAFGLAAALLIVAPFCTLYSTRLGGYFAVDGWGRATVRPDDGLSITYLEPIYGIAAWTVAGLLAVTAGLQLGSPAKSPIQLRLFAAVLDSGLIAGVTGILVLDLLLVLKDPDTQVGPFIYVVGAAVVVCATGTWLTWRSIDIPCSRSALDTDVEL
jgi:hypothetical protein